MFLRKK